MDGLDSLNTIAGFLDIGNNPLLSDLYAMGEFTSIGGYLSVYGNNSLVYLDGFDALTTIKENLNLFFNPALQDIAGLENIKEIGGNISISGNNNLIKPRRPR
ncbi:MAG: hypothetical protein IPH94_20425 [Saprospiraceae bacterium]|nr:hypothetical protein [Saprospiraceae bacterium]